MNFPDLFHIGSIFNFVLVIFGLHFLFPREKRENEEFHDEKFLTRKTDEKTEELTSVK